MGMMFGDAERGNGGERVEDLARVRELAVRAARLLDSFSRSLSRSEPDDVDPPVLWKVKGGRAVGKPGDGNRGLAFPDPVTLAPG